MLAVIEELVIEVAAVNRILVLFSKLFKVNIVFIYDTNSSFVSGGE